MANIKRFLSFSVTAVFLLMCLVYYTTIFVFIEDCMSLKGYYGMLNALIFSSLAVMCFASFISSVVLDPGYVPPSYVPEIEDSSVSDPAVKRNGANSRFCEKCATHKPPRAHHCRVCKRCLLRMDHHCTWINNCVGFSNYKPFIIFLLYAAISSSYSLVVIVIAILQKDWGFHGQTRLKIFYAICGSIMTVLSVTLGTLLIWHIYLLMHNMTTIEYHEGKRAEWLARKSGQSYRHPFDLGVLKNIILILGTNILAWPCPTAVGHLKDGTNFPTSHGS